MRTLFLSEQVPYPLDSARNQRIYQLLKGVAAASEVTLVCFLRSDGEREYLEPLRSLCSAIHCVPPDCWGHKWVFEKPRPFIWAHELAGYLHPTRPVLVRWYESPYARQLVANLCEQSFDLIWAERLPCMDLLPPHVSTRVIVDIDDLEHRKLAHRLRHTGWYAEKPFHAIEYLKMKRVESNLLNTGFEFAVCSSVDRAAFGDSNRVWVVPNGVNPKPESVSSTRLCREPIFVFLGSMDYAPNIDGVRWLTRDIFPLILRELPEAKLHIVGRDPAPAVRALHNGHNITVTGRVPTIEPYLRGAAAVVASIRFGGGTRIKILEAMSARTPVVATTIGAEGIEARAGVHLLIADDPRSLADACVKLWQNPVLAKGLADSALRLIEHHYTWGQIGYRIQEMLCARG
jgi:glycosyltransferase involved in cell wall biosynthesis